MEWGDKVPPLGLWYPEAGEVAPALAPLTPGLHLQKLRVLLAQLLEQGRQQCRILLNHLPHVLELGLVPQELQGILSCWQKAGM